MSSVMKELKSEISRVARREINKELEPVKRVNAAQRGLIAELRRQLTALQKDWNAMKKGVVSALPEPGVKGSARASGTGKKKDAREGFWITGKGIRSLRTRLNLTQPDLARLAGVSSWTVVNWESDKGKIAIRRKDTAAKLQEIRTAGKRQITARLAELG